MQSFNARGMCVHTTNADRGIGLNPKYVQEGSHEESTPTGFVKRHSHSENLIP